MGRFVARILFARPSSSAGPEFECKYQRGVLPDYASFQIETGQLKQTLETLERGGAILWSEMRGLRTSTDQLRTVDPALAEKFVDIIRRLESVTMSVAHGDVGVMDGDETGTGRGAGLFLSGRPNEVVEKRGITLGRWVNFVHFIMGCDCCVVSYLICEGTSLCCPSSLNHWVIRGIVRWPDQYLIAQVRYNNLSRCLDSVRFSWRGGVLAIQ